LNSKVHREVRGRTLTRYTGIDKEAVGAGRRETVDVNVIAAAMVGAAVALCLFVIVVGLLLGFIIDPAANKLVQKIYEPICYAAAKEYYHEEKAGEAYQRWQDIWEVITKLRLHRLEDVRKGLKEIHSDQEGKNPFLSFVINWRTREAGFKLGLWEVKFLDHDGRETRGWQLTRKAATDPARLREWLSGCQEAVNVVTVNPTGLIVNVRSREEVMACP